MRRSWISWPNFGFAIVLVVLGGIAHLSHRNTQSVANATENRKNAFMRIDQLQTLLAAMVDIETGARGYVITGDPVFLEPYDWGIERLVPQLNRVHAAVAERPLQQSELADLEESTNLLLRQARHVVSLKANRADGSAERAVATGAGKQTMDRIRGIIAALSEEDRKLLQEGDQTHQTGLRWSMLIIVAGSLFGVAAVVLATVAINWSLSARIKANARLKQSLADNTQLLRHLRATGAELSRSNQELEQFAYVASHDLQEPLRKVSSFAQLLATKYRDKLDGDANEFIGYMVDGAKRMQTLIQNLLAYSRLGRKGQTFVPVDGNSVLKQALANLDGAIDESGVVITSELLPTVFANEGQLVQLFQNLIGNAIKFRGEEKLAIQIRADRTGKDWTFSVRDNGIGIDPQFAERIFVIFQRLHSREEYPGTGIGLAFCKKIVERHGGTIWLEPHTGPGATFCFTLPPSVHSEQPTQEPVNESQHDRDFAGGRRPGRRPLDGRSPQVHENVHESQHRP